MTDQPQGATLTATPTETVTTVTTTVITQTAPVDETAHAQAVPVAAGEDEITPSPRAFYGVYPSEISETPGFLASGAEDAPSLSQKGEGSLADCLF